MTNKGKREQIKKLVALIERSDMDIATIALVLSNHKSEVANRSSNFHNEHLEIADQFRALYLELSSNP